MSNLYFEIPGNVTIAVFVTEINESSLMFDLSIPNSDATLSMLEQIQFELDDSGILGGIAIKGLGNFAERCAPVDASSKQTASHVCVRFDPTEVSIKEKSELCFVMSHDQLNLSLDTVFGQNFAVQLTKTEQDAKLVDFQTRPDATAAEAGMMGMLRAMTRLNGKQGTASR